MLTNRLFTIGMIAFLGIAFPGNSIQKVEKLISQISSQANPNQPIGNIGLFTARVDVKKPVSLDTKLKFSKDPNRLDEIALRLGILQYGAKEVTYQHYLRTENRLCIIDTNGNACLSLPVSAQIGNVNTETSNEVSAPAALT